MKPIFKTLAVAGALAASVCVATAQPYYLAGRFEGWCNNCTVMTDNGLVGTNGIQGSHQYEYDISGQTPNSYDNNNNGMKVTDGTWNNTWPGNNMYVYYGAAGTLSVYFYPGSFTDGWFPTSKRVGYSDNGSPWEVTGTLTTPQYGSDPNAQMSLVAGSAGVYTNIYVVAAPGTYQWKCRTSGTWNDMQAGTDFSDNPGTLAFTTTTPNQAVTFWLDLPNGRVTASVPPVFCNIQFSVDMTLVAQTDPGFNPSSVTINGDALNAWGGTACTNNPTAANTNVYTSPYFNLVVGTTVNYQFRYSSGGSTVYDGLGGISGVNRTLTVQNFGSTNVPTVYFNDALPTDLLNMDTTVYFSLNMTNAVGHTNGVVDEVFNPSTDYVYINGDFVGWLNWDPVALYSAGLKLTQNDPTTEVYNYSMLFPKGHSRSLTYKYSINGADDEAGYAQNHFRYIRSTNGVYYLPMDTFGTQYTEPKVGGLTISTSSAGALPVTWLPYPNVSLQTSSNLVNWVNLPNTTGASSTNWPSTNGTAFFRLIQSN